MNTKDLTTWLEISESSYAANLAFFKQRLTQNTELSVVVKSNAYGHGMAEIARLAIKHGADSFCVHALDEAIQLRQWGYKQDILIMGPVMISRLDEVLKNDFRLILYNQEALSLEQNLSRQYYLLCLIFLSIQQYTCIFFHKFCLCLL